MTCLFLYLHALLCGKPEYTVFGKSVYIYFDSVIRCLCWFQGRDTTPEEQRVKFVKLASKMKSHPDFKEKYAEDPDEQNRDIAFRKIFDDVMSRQRKSGEH